MQLIKTDDFGEALDKVTEQLRSGSCADVVSRIVAREPDAARRPLRLLRDGSGGEIVELWAVKPCDFQEAGNGEDPCVPHE